MFRWFFRWRFRCSSAADAFRVRPSSGSSAAGDRQTTCVLCYHVTEKETVFRDTAQFAESLAPAVSPVAGPRAEVMRATRPERIQLRLGLRGRILCAQQFVDVCGRFVGRKFKEPRPDRKNRSLNDTDHLPQSEDSLKTTEVKPTTS